MAGPITIATVGHFVFDKAAEKVLDTDITWFEQHVTSCWSRHRAKRFLAQLIEELRKQQDVKYESASPRCLVRRPHFMRFA